jgi:SAM-dependent methyltransferase
MEASRELIATQTDRGGQAGRTWDTPGAEAFAERLVDIFNAGAATLMISIGHRTGLFDTMSEMPPATSREIADRSGLDERYVREWLGAVTCAGIVTTDGSSTLYHLPPEHAASLTRAVAADNLAVFAQYVAVLGAVEDRIVTCFHDGGGVAYEHYGRFHEVMAEDSGQSVVSVLIDEILPLVPGAVLRLEQGSDVLDFGCGSGRALVELATHFPRSRFTGYDLSETAIATARREAAARGLDNLRFEARDLTGFDERARYDLVLALDAIHDQKAPDRSLAAIARALRSGGALLMQDIAGSCHVHKNLDHPLGTLLYTISCLHCMSVSLSQGGAGLGAMWGREQALELLRQAGFQDVVVNDLPHDVQNHYYTARVR